MNRSCALGASAAPSQTPKKSVFQSKPFFLLRSVPFLYNYLQQGRLYWCVLSEINGDAPGCACFPKWELLGGPRLIHRREDGMSSLTFVFFYSYNTFLKKTEKNYIYIACPSSWCHGSSSTAPRNQDNPVQGVIKHASIAVDRIARARDKPG